MNERSHNVDLHGPAGAAHLIGVGGAGMRSLAQVLLDRGWCVTGSDREPLTARFNRVKGVSHYAGHAADHVAASTTVAIHSSAIAADNPELRRAMELKIPALSYAEALAKLMQDRVGLAVAGVHGKSTTTAMAAEILIRAGRDPTVVYGAQPLGGAQGGRSGNGAIVLVEACEFMENFLFLRPQHAAILNIDWDHVDCFATPEAVEQAFARFAALLPPAGRLIVPMSDRAARRAAKAAHCQVLCFNAEGDAMWQAVRLNQRFGLFSFDLCLDNVRLGTVALRVPGRHNVENALAAAALVHGLGLSPDDIRNGLSQFPGLRRRLETVATVAGITWIDDYAHHPTEIAASLAAVRQMHPGRRLCCVFQPHQTARTAQFLDQLAQSLQNAEQVIITDIFRAREGRPKAGDVTAADLARAVRATGQSTPAVYTAEELTSFLATQLTAGDVLVTMGAGDIGRIGYGLMERIGCGCAAQ